VAVAGGYVPRCECSADGCRAVRELAEITVRRVGDVLVGIIGGHTFVNERHARAPLGRIVFQREP
jgi:hypothetical protein